MPHAPEARAGFFCACLMMMTSARCQLSLTVVLTRIVVTETQLSGEQWFCFETAKKENVFLLSTDVSITDYSLYQAKCRDISRYISVVLKDIEPKFGTRNKWKKCMLNIKIYPLALQINAFFFSVSVIYFSSRKVSTVIFFVSLS